MIDQLKNGNKAALKKAYELYSEKVYHVAYSYTRQSDAAKDIVQDVFIKLWKNRSKISEVHSLDHQLFVITKNMLHDHYRRSVLEEKVLANFKDLISVAESEDNSVQEQRLKKVQNWMSQLPKKQQKVFKMHRFQGLTYDEIATSLNISVNTVSAHITSSMRFLKDQID